MVLMALSCQRSAPVIEDRDNYIKSVEQWQADRLEGLKGKDGWLNLAGIYWLKGGGQTFGSHPSNDHVFPEKAPAFIGTLNLREGNVHVNVNKEISLFYKGEQVHEFELGPESSGHPSYVTHGDFAWYIMKRNQSLAIRLRNYKNPAIEALEYIPSYPIDPDYAVEAKLLPFAEPRTITVNTPFILPMPTCPHRASVKPNPASSKMRGP